MSNRTATARAVLALVLAAAARPAAAEVSFRNLEPMTLVLPPGVFHSERDMVGQELRATVLEPTPEGGVTVAGFEDWQTRAYPMMLECKAWRPKKSKRPGYIRLDLACGGGPMRPPFYRLYAPGKKPEEAQPYLAHALTSGSPSSPESKAYYREACAKIADRVFTGALAGQPDEVKMALVTSFPVQEGAVAIFTSEYKGGLYFHADLGTHGEVYNTIQLQRAARVAKVVSETLLSRLKSVARKVGKLEGLAGVAIVTRVSYRNLVSDGEAGTDKLELLAPLEVVRRFIDDEITGQQLIDESVVRVDGSRTEVDLSSY